MLIVSCEILPGDAAALGERWVWHERGRWAVGHCRHLLPAFALRQPSLQRLTGHSRLPLSSSCLVPGALLGTPGLGLPTVWAPAVDSGAGAASWAPPGIRSVVKTGGSSLRAFSLLWCLPRSSPEQRNPGAMQSGSGPWTPMHRFCGPLLAVGRAVLCEGGALHANECFLLAAHRCGRPELCTPVKQSTTRSSPSRRAPCLTTVSPRPGGRAWGSAGPGAGADGLNFQAVVPGVPGT